MDKDQPVDFHQTSLGPLPQEWEIVSLSKILTPRTRKVRLEPGKTYTRLGVRWYAQGPFKKDAVQGRDIRGANLYQVQGSEFIYNRLFAWKGSFGVIPEEMDGCFVSGEFPVFEVNRSIADPHYVWRWFSLPSVWRTIEDRSTGSTRVSRLRFKIDDLLTMSIPLPPLSEQRAIASVLRTVQRAIAATEQVITAARELKRALMRHLFTYGPVAVGEAGQVALRETEIGPMPEHWEVVPLGNVSGISTGTTPSTKEPRYYDGTIPFVRTSEIANRPIVLPAMYVSDEAIRQYHLKIYPPGTVFMAMYGQGKTRGQVAILRIAATTSQNTAAMVADERLQPEFLWLHLMNQYQNLRLEGIQGHISHLNLGYVKSLPIPLPLSSEQRDIARMVCAVDRKTTAEEARKVVQENLFKTLLHHLMTGRVRVPC